RRHPRNMRERPRHRAPDNRDADRDEHDRKGGKRRQDEPSAPDLPVEFAVEPLEFSVIELAEPLDVLVERLAYAAVGVVVAPFAASRRIDLGSAARQLFAEVHELVDPPDELAEVAGARRALEPLPLGHDRGEALVELPYALSIDLHDR